MIRVSQSTEKSALLQGHGINTIINGIVNFNINVNYNSIVNAKYNFAVDVNLIVDLDDSSSNYRTNKETSNF